jgi:hypothetical protein
VAEASADWKKFRGCWTALTIKFFCGQLEVHSSSPHGEVDLAILAK